MVAINPAFNSQMSREAPVIQKSLSVTQANAEESTDNALANDTSAVNDQMNMPPNSTETEPALTKQAVPATSAPFDQKFETTTTGQKPIDGIDMMI